MKNMKPTKSKSSLRSPKGKGVKKLELKQKSVIDDLKNCKIINKNSVQDIKDYMNKLMTSDNITEKLKKKQSEEITTRNKIVNMEPILKLNSSNSDIKKTLDLNLSQRSEDFSCISKSQEIFVNQGEINFIKEENLKLKEEISILNKKLIEMKNSEVKLVSLRYIISDEINEFLINLKKLGADIQIKKIEYQIFSSSLNTFEEEYVTKFFEDLTKFLAKTLKNKEKKIDSPNPKIENFLKEKENEIIFLRKSLKDYENVREELKYYRDLSRFYVEKPNNEVICKENNYNFKNNNFPNEIRPSTSYPEKMFTSYSNKYENMNNRGSNNEYLIRKY